MPSFLLCKIMAELTLRKLKQVKKICGIGFKIIDIPAIWRKNKGEDEARAIDAMAEELRQENIPPIPDPFDLK